MKLFSIAGIASLALAVALAASTLAPHSATAQDQSFAPEHLKAAAGAIAATRSDVGFDEILPIVADETKTLLMQSNPEYAREIDAMVTEVAIKLAVKRPELDRTLQEVWARRFSAEELNQITAFYTSPVGAKLAEKTPELSALSIGAARKFREDLGTEMLSLARPEMDKIKAPAKN